MPIPASRALAPCRPFPIVRTDRERRLRPVIRQVADRRSCEAVPKARRRMIAHRFLDHDVRVFEHGEFRCRMRPFTQSGPWAPIAGFPGCPHDDDC